MKYNYHKLRFIEKVIALAPSTELSTGLQVLGEDKAT
jgi:hypothetical protein